MGKRESLRKLGQINHDGRFPWGDTGWYRRMSGEIPAIRFRNFSAKLLYWNTTVRLIHFVLPNPLYPIGLWIVNGYGPC